MARAARVVRWLAAAALALGVLAAGPAPPAAAQEPGGATSTMPSATTAGTGPPSAPPTAPTSTAVPQPRTRITQESPDLTAVLVLWVLGIAGTASILAATWWRNRPDG